MNNIQWYPGHMTKTRRMMEENISLVDIVIELVGCKNSIQQQKSGFGYACEE